MIEEIANKAVELNQCGKYNCAQAVAIALANKTNLDEATLFQMTAGFGVGMGTMKGVCGALVGANIILGLYTKGIGTLRYSSALSKEFESRCGAIICKDLKALTDGKPLCPCRECVRNAVLAFGKVTGIE